MLRTYSVEMFVTACCDDLDFLKEGIPFHRRIFFGNGAGM